VHKVTNHNNVVLNLIFFVSFEKSQVHQPRRAPADPCARTGACAAPASPGASASGSRSKGGPERSGTPPPRGRTRRRTTGHTGSGGQRTGNNTPNAAVSAACQQKTKQESKHARECHASLFACADRVRLT